MLAAGKHDIELVNDLVGFREMRTVQVTSGRVAALSIAIPKGTVSLNAVPWATVSIDGENVGDTPIGNFPLAVGQHEVVFRNTELGEQRPDYHRHAAHTDAAQRRSDTKMRTSFLVTCILLLSPMALHAEDSVAAARDLYTSANYEDALVVLNRLDSSSGQPSDRMAINQYRAFCLLALGRMAEAERAIEAVLTVDLLYRPVDADMSPRLRAAFAGVRQRILPAIVQQEYARAKAAFDHQDYPAAIAQFDRVLRALGSPDLGAVGETLPSRTFARSPMGFAI
jgi:tetratricopeptide (TPR) repeat protein